MRRAPTLRSAFFAQRALPRATPLVSQRSFQTLSSISAPSATLSKVPRNLPSPFLAKRLFAARVINTPQFADSITEGELAKWEVEVGSKVKRDQLVAVVETDKVDIEINAPESGTIEELFANQGDTIQTGSKLYSLMPGEVSESDASKKEEPKAKEAPKAKEEPKAKEDSKAKEEPKAKEAPKEESKSKDAPKSTPPPPSPSSASDPSPGEETKVKMSRLRLRIAERLKESQNTAASLTTFNEVDLRALTDMREKYKEEFQKKHGVKFGFMSAFLKAASIALQDVPEVNARIEGENIVYHNYVDISVAVATPKGLVTPVLRGVEAMSYAGIEKELGALGQKAKEGKITIEDMAGGTFTVSNGGVFGSLMGTPIINMPQSAILGMHGIKERPVAVGGEVKIRPMMYIALTYDHRLIDGREAVTFLVRVKQLVEDPSRLLLGL